MPALQTVASLLAQAGSDLPHSESPDIDARFLLADVLQCSVSQLLVRGGRELTVEQAQRYAAMLQRRRTGEPIAYVLGSQGFWSLELEVAPHTLIPRPDTETLVEHALTLPLPAQARVLDLGTGTGAIALALAAERPAWQVLGVDRVADAVLLAEKNRQQLGFSRVQFLQSHWFDSVEGSFDLIVSNPPYIRSDDPHLAQGDVRFEPLSALISGEDGLDDIRHIIQQAPHFLNEGGWLWLEHGFDQAEAVRDLLALHGYVEISSQRDLGGHERISGARRFK